MKNRLFLLGGLLMLNSCSKEEKPLPTAPPTVYKENAYELNLLTERLSNGQTVMVLAKTIYVKGVPTKKVFISADTLPFIGSDEANIVEEDEDGNTITSSKRVAKDYDVLFKVDTLDATRKQGFSWDSTNALGKDSANKKAAR